MLCIKNLSKKYSSEKVLQNINLNLRPGEITGLFGENGAGKTTLMKCILDFISYEGEISLDGEKISKNNITRISFAASEHSFFPNLTAGGHREFYKAHFEHFSDKRFSGLMKFFDLPDNKALKHFSGGQKNQFEVILALSQGADYILMDEPFAGNDIFNREDFYKLLSGILSDSETVLIATHLVEEVSSVINRAVLLREGKIIGDKTADELESEGSNFVKFVKDSFNYQPGRVSEALFSMVDEEEQA